jgi:hypothetical protein
MHEMNQCIISRFAGDGNASFDAFPAGAIIQARKIMERLNNAMLLTLTSYDLRHYLAARSDA